MAVWALYWVHEAGTLLGTRGTPGTIVEGFNNVTSLMFVSLQFNTLKNSKYVNKSQIWLVIWGKCLSGGKLKLCLLHPSEKRSRVVFLELCCTCGAERDCWCLPHLLVENGAGNGNRRSSETRNKLLMELITYWNKPWEEILDPLSPGG